MKKIISFLAIIPVVVCTYTASAQIGDTAATHRQMDSLMKVLGGSMNNMMVQNTTDTAHFKDKEVFDDNKELTLAELIEHPSDVSFININLNSNHIQALPEGFENLNDLTFLIICNLPKGSSFDFNGAINVLAKMPNIEEIYFMNNGKGLTSIPASIGEMHNLKRLSFFRNALTSLPEELGNLDSLKELSLELNQLAKLPSSMTKLKNLEKLQLDKNPISDAELNSLREALPKCKITISK